LSFAGGEVTVHRLQPLAAWTEKLSRLVMTATPQPEIRKVLPDATVVTVPAAAEPHVHSTFVVGGFGLGRGRAIRKNRLVKEALDFERQVLGIGKSLVVTHKAAEHVFAGDPAIAPLHHGAVTGTDRHGGVDLFAIVGTMTPPPEAISKRASALAGRYVAAEPMTIGSAIVELRDGTAIALPSPVYTNPELQAALDSIRQSELNQDRGRMRAASRTAATPVHEFVFGNVPPAGVAFDRVIPWGEFRLGLPERMVARRRVYLNAADAYRMHPDLFPSYEAARKALQRLGRDTLIARSHFAASRLRDRWVWVRYQPAGQGQQPRRAAAPHAELPAMQAELEQTSGAPLVVWETCGSFTEGREVRDIGIFMNSDGMSRSSGNERARPPLSAAPAASATARAPPDG
jgi:hypothetical protein